VFARARRCNCDNTFISIFRVPAVGLPAHPLIPAISPMEGDARDQASDNG